MHGLLNVHKPKGMTSRRVVDIVARRAQTRRTGHAGTLDPLASGVLVVCIGWTTRLVPLIQERSKTYSARFLLGRRSDTDDSTGQVVEASTARVPPREEVAQAISRFTGAIMQVPPQFSAVHVGGRRAHKLARRGRAVTLEPRPVEVHRIELVNYCFPEVELEIECGSGTYIRSIARDLGEALGCGGLMSALVRRAVGDFTLESAHSIEDLQTRPIEELLLPPLAAVAHLPRRLCTAGDREELLCGRSLVCPPEISHPDGTLFALVDDANQLLALAEHDSIEHRLRPHQVFIQQGSSQKSRHHR